LEPAGNSKERLNLGGREKLELTKRRVLVVDDSLSTLKVLMAILADEGYEVLRATSGPKALRILQANDHIDAVLADLKMPGMDGLELYRKTSEIREPPPFIIMTAYGTVKSAVHALKEGVTHYLIKPIDFDELTIILDKAIREHENANELKKLRGGLKQEDSFHNVIGASQKMKDIFNMVLTVGPTDASVLIQGETGTGKELLARAIHAESNRRDRKIVCINSAALTESLLESELFGYVKGAFTGAAADREGLLDTAHGGTLFLDEIGHMSLRLQSKILRFLQEMVFEPVGSTESRAVDVRLIAATNLDLQKEIDGNRFMSDLLYRVEVISMRVPPLRERREDIPLLVNHFLVRNALKYGKAVASIHPEAMALLSAYDWPGNVRELKNCVTRAVILAKDPMLQLMDFPDKIASRKGQPDERSDGRFVTHFPSQGIKIRDMEIELIRKTLEECHGNKSVAAQFLGISRKTLYEKMERYQIVM
jgi:DNA-binding NtrC family response regulator